MRKRGMIGHMAAAAVVLSLISTSLLSGTLAKYTTSVTVEDTAKVAKFAFTMTDKEPSGSGTGNTQTETGTTAVTFKIFETNDTAVADGTTDQKLIAPGTNGKFNFEFKNTSDVAVEDSYKIELTGDQETAAASGEKQIPLVIKFGDKYYSDFFATGDSSVVVRAGDGTADTGSAVSITGPISGDFDTANSLAKAVSESIAAFKQVTSGTPPYNHTYGFEWCWAFEGNNKDDASASANKQSDKSDTYLGTMGTLLEPKLKIDLTVKQLDNFPPVGGGTTVPTTP